MKRINYTLETEDWEKQNKAGRFNPNEDILIRYHNSEYRLNSGHGQTDCVEVFREDKTVYVLVMNTRHEYCGLAVYDLSGRDERRNPLDCYNEIFLQFDYEITSILGPKGLDLADTTILRRLMEYLN